MSIILANGSAVLGGKKDSRISEDLLRKSDLAFTLKGKLLDFFTTFWAFRLKLPFKTSLCISPVSKMIPIDLHCILQYVYAGI